jgi:hypothetical protein
MSNQGTGEGPDYPPAGLPHEISQRAFEGGSAVLSARLGMQQVLQAVEDVLGLGGHQEFHTSTDEGAFDWLATGLARSRGSRERPPGEVLGGTLDGTKEGRGTQRALQSVEDALLAISGSTTLPSAAAKGLGTGKPTLNRRRARAAVFARELIRSGHEGLLRAMA